MKMGPKHQIDLQSKGRDHTIGKSQARLRLFVGTMLLCGASLSAALAAQVDYCRATSNDVLASCQAGAQSDYSLALGKCDNLSTPRGAASLPQTGKHRSERRDADMHRPAGRAASGLCPARRNAL